MEVPLFPVRCRGKGTGRILPRQLPLQDFATAMAPAGDLPRQPACTWPFVTCSYGQGFFSVGPPRRRGRALAAPRAYRKPVAAGRPARIMEDLLSELRYRLQDESIVNASISPYLARINAYIESVRRVNHPEQSELLRAVENVRSALEECRLGNQSSSTPIAPTRVYTGE